MATIDENLVGMDDFATLKLKVNGKLGKGAFGDVYKAELEKEVVAVKVLALDPDADKASRTAYKHFVKEAEVLKRCKHPNIIRYISLTKLGAQHGLPKKDMTTADGLRWALVEEIMKGGSVSHTICKQMSNPHAKVYSDLDAWHWASDLASALKYLHGLQPAIIHRDVKSANVLLTPQDGRVVAKLSDFGLHVTMSGNALNRAVVRARAASPLCEEHGTIFFRPVKEEKYEPHYHAVPNASLRSTHLKNKGNGGSPVSARILGAWAINRHSMPQSTQELRSRIDAATPDAVEVFARGETNLSDESAAAVPAATSGPDVSLVYDLTGRTGSCMYMAPEVFCHEPYDEKVDVYGFGVVMYELFARTILIFTELDRNATIDAQAPERYARKVANGYRPARPSTMPDEVWRLISACWAQDPVERPGMDTVTAALQGMRCKFESAKGKKVSAASSSDCCVM